MSSNLKYFLRFHFVTVGKAINGRDFRRIKKNDANLYEYIYDGLTSGYCYSINFEILKILKEGKIDFLAVKALQPRPHRPLTAHVVFEKNGYIYDTSTNRQYPKDKYMRALDAIEWKSVSYSDIKDCRDLDQFRSKYGKEFAKWCGENFCHCCKEFYLE